MIYFLLLPLGPGFAVVISHLMHFPRLVFATSVGTVLQTVFCIWLSGSSVIKVPVVQSAEDEHLEVKRKVDILSWF